MIDIIAAAKKHWPAALALGAVVSWAIMIRWSAPISALHDFRQSQTANSAYWMLRDGISLLFPPLPVFGIEHISVPMEFPLYQAVVAFLAKSFGGDPVNSIVTLGRIVNFSFFLLSGYALARIVRLLHGDRVAAVTLALFLFMPFGVSFSATVNIEFDVLAATLFYFEAVYRLAMCGETGWRVQLWGLFAGVLALLLKVTTALVYGPALVLLWICWVRGREIRPSMGQVAFATLLVAVIPLGIGYGWVVWSDAIKAQSPLTAFLTSSGSSTWNYGTLAERLMPGNWFVIFVKYWGTQIYAVAGLPFAAFGAYQLWKEDRFKLLLWLLPAATGIGVFFNIYRVHNYYHLAILPGLMAVMAYGLVEVLDRFKMKQTVLWVGVVVVAAWGSIVLEAQIPGYHLPAIMLSEFRMGPPVWFLPYQHRDVLSAEMLRRHTKPSDVTMISNGDWSSIVPFMAERRVLMVRNCAADLRGRPHLDYYLIDKQRSKCPALHIPKRCLVLSKDGIVLGNCIQR